MTAKTCTGDRISVYGSRLSSRAHAHSAAVLGRGGRAGGGASVVLNCGRMSASKESEVLIRGQLCGKIAGNDVSLFKNLLYGGKLGRVCAAQNLSRL